MLITHDSLIYFLILWFDGWRGGFIALFVHLLDYFSMLYIWSNLIETKSWTNWKEGIYTERKIQIDMNFFWVHD